MMAPKSKLINESGPPGFRRALLRWFDLNQRELPWRASRDPYRVWVSEIMLQQTRVAAVIDYFQRFVAEFPSVQVLASASESSVLTLWSGLGYYRRARSLHQAAKRIVHELGGAFPATGKELQTLPGIGRYTAAAIASIAFGEAVAVVDGNVERVLSRLYSRPELASKDAWNLAEELLSRKRPGDFNQAMMELGATICTPVQPVCPACPVRNWCGTKGAFAPAPKPPRVRVKVKYMLSMDKKGVWLVRRPEDTSVMPGMWELPTAHDVTVGCELLFSIRHSIMQTDYTVSVVSGRHGGDAHYVPRNQIEGLPLTGLARKILRRADII